MSKRIMWADDNEVFRKSMIATLERECEHAKIDVTFNDVPDGEDMVREVEASNYDLVFTDNVMLRMNGLEAIQAIRRTEKGRNVPIYMVSSSEVGQRAIKAGATGYLDKQDERFPCACFQEIIDRHLK